jgi:TonB family protein
MRSSTPTRLTAVVVIALSGACASHPESGAPSDAPDPERLCEGRWGYPAESVTASGAREALEALGWLSGDEIQLVPLDERPRLVNSRQVQRLLMEEYPPDLRAEGVSGSTVFDLLVSGEGKVALSEVRRPATRRAFDLAAAPVLNRMVFSPITHDGCRLPFMTQMLITFETFE